MKKTIYIFLSIFLLFSCKEQNQKQVETHKTTHNLAIKNPLNKLKYAAKVDFYCQMDITKYGVSDTTTYNGQLYGFCSKMCKDEFLKMPEKYLAKK